MHPTTFDDGLDRYGADLAAWPAEMREAAAALLAASATARDAWQLMSEIEGTIRADQPSGPRVDLIAARAMRARQDQPLRRIARRSGWAVAAVAVLAIGFMLGGADSDHENGSDRTLIAAFDQVGPMDVD